MLLLGIVIATLGSVISAISTTKAKLERRGGSRLGLGFFISLAGVAVIAFGGEPWWALAWLVVNFLLTGLLEGIAFRLMYRPTTTVTSRKIVDTEPPEIPETHERSKFKPHSEMTREETIEDLRQLKEYLDSNRHGSDDA